MGRLTTGRDQIIHHRNENQDKLTTGEIKSYITGIKREENDRAHPGIIGIEFVRTFVR